MGGPPVRQLSAPDLCERFNEGGYQQLAESGELQSRLLKDGHPAPPRSGDPLCTRSQTLAYINAEGEKVAVVHRYLRPDGSLGASGRPDPKRLFEDGVLYVLFEP
jgi:hypothetical protein